MNGTYLWSSTIGCFLLTYAAHSTILIVGVSALICWTKPTRPQVRKLLWRVALVGGVVTSLIQTVAPIPHWGVQFSLAMDEPKQSEDDSADAATEMRTHDRWSLGSAPVAEKSEPAGGVTGAAWKRGEALTASTEGSGVRQRTWAVAAARLLTWLWLAGSTCVLLALVRQHIALRRIESNSQRITDGRLWRLVRRLGPRLGVEGPVQVFSTALVGGPMATGVRRLRIFLPIDFLKQLDTEQVEALLAHELAHLARRDPLWSLIGFLTCRIFFFQPLNLYARRQLSVEAEFVADQCAASVLADRLGLARCLATLGQWLSTGCHSHVVAPYGVGLFSFDSLLGKRVERILDRVSLRRWTWRHRAGWNTVIVVMVLATLIIGPRANGVAPDVQSGQNGASMNATTTRAEIGSVAVSLGLSAVQADDEKPVRPTDRDVLKQQVEVFGIALNGLLEAEKKDVAGVLQRAIRAREVMLEGRWDDEAHQIRERAPSREQLTRVLTMAAGVWREFDNQEKAAAVSRVAEELAKRPGDHQPGREHADQDSRERTERPTERDILKRRIEVMKTAMPALRERKRGEAVELLERAVRAYEVALEDRSDEEAQRIRQRMPSRGQLAEILTLASDLWREFNNQDKAEVVGRLAKELAGQGGRDRSEEQQVMIGFNGQVRGVVVEKGRENTIAFEVARVVRIWPRPNKAKEPEALAGRTITIAPNSDLQARFLGKLRQGQEVTLDIRGGERNRFVITELGKEQKSLATAD